MEEITGIKVQYKCLKSAYGSDEIKNSSLVSYKIIFLRRVEALTNEDL